MVRSRPGRLALVLVTAVLCSCSALQAPLALGTPPSMPIATASSIEPLMPLSTSEDLFIAAESPGALAPPSHAARSRVVKLNLSLLLDSRGQARALPAEAEIGLNLFPDVVYVGVIDEVQKQGDGATWVGRLKDVDNSYMYLVYTAGVFIGHFASPAGVFEVSIVGDDLYQIIEVDQAGLGGGEEPID